MFRHFITSINYKQLIEMQAKQASFAPGRRSAKATLKNNNRNSNAKVKTFGKRK